MPLYEYECMKCKHRFERIQSFSDQPVKKCPKCGGPVVRLLSAPAVQFKGTGWYVTDYARKSSPGGKQSEGAGGDSSDGVEKGSKPEKDRVEAKSDKDKGESKAKTDSKKSSKKQS